MKLDLSMFPKIIADTHRAVKKITKADDMLIMQAIMGVCSTCTQSLYNVDTRLFGIKPISSYFFTIAETGGRKSTVFNLLTKPITEYEEMRDDEYDLDMQKYKVKYARYTKEIKTNINAEEPPHPEKPNYKIATCTTNGLKSVLQYNSFIGLINDEAGTQLSNYALKKDNANEFAGQLQTAWDGAPIQKLTGLEDFKYTHRRVSLCWAAQNDISRQFLDNPIFRSFGLFARINIVQIPPIVMIKNDNSYDILDTTELEPFYKRARQLLEEERPYANPGNDADFNLACHSFSLKPHTLEMDDAAFDKTNVLYNEIHEVCNDEDAEHNAKGYILKVQEHTMRLAAILCAFDRKKRINVTHVEAAQHLVEHYVEYYLSQKAAINDYLVRDSLILVEWLKGKDNKSWREILQCAKPYNVKADYKRKIVKECIARGLISESIVNGKVSYKYIEPTEALPEIDLSADELLEKLDNVRKEA